MAKDVTTNPADIHDQYLLCRTIGHSWDDNPTSDFKAGFSWVIALRCTRCTMERFDYLNTSGEVLNRYYRAPLGYRTVRATRLSMRAEMMRRHLLAIRLNGRTARRKS